MPTVDTPVLTWIVLAILSAVVEVSIPQFGMIFASLGAVAAAGAAGLGFGIAVQLVTFVVVLAASLAVLRPLLIGRAGTPGVPSRTQTLVGRDGLVTQDIDPTVGTGRVNVGGEDWAARAPHPLPSGTRIRVTGADGIVLEVTAA